MTGRDRPEPLWASSLADQPRPDYDDVVVRVLEEEPDETPAPPPDHRPPGERRVFLAAVGATLALVAVALALQGRDSFRIVDVPSYWGDVPMTCKTARLERGDRAVEWFWCRARGGRALPPGLYRSPDSQWTSDITRRDARQSRIRIERDGDLAGWATY